MGKKGHHWFSAIKKVFTSSSKDKQPLTTNNNKKKKNEGDKVSSKEKKGGGLGRLKHGSFIPPLFRAPSSIEQILGEIDQQNLYIAHPPPPPQQPQAQPSSSYSGRPVSPTPPPQQSQAQPSSTSARPVSPTPPPHQSQAQPSSTSARPVSPPQQPQAQPSSTSARPVSPPQQPQAQPSSSYSGRPLSPPHQSQAQPSSSSSSSARPVSPPQQPQAQPSSSYSGRPLSPPHQSQAQPSSSSARPVTPPQVISSPKSGITTPPPIASYAPPPPRFVHSQTQVSRRPKPTLQQQHLSAIRIQAAYRGHMVRRNIKGLTGLVRLQGVVRGQNVKRQTVNAMKQMQLVVRVQTQIQSRRIQTLENQALKRQANNNNDKRSETSLGNKRSEMGDEYWDDSSITKEERDARSQKKVEAVIRRERAMAYASSHQVRKGTPTSAQNSLMDIRTGGYPWWSNWLDRQLPNSNTPQPLKNLQKQSTTTSSRSRTPDDKRTHKQLDHLDSPSTPMSSRSMAPPSMSRTPPSQMMKYSRARRGGGSPYSMKDDDSLMSCPQFSSVPNYMSPTVSAKAKARPTTSSNSKDRVTPSTPGSETSKRRFSFPFSPNSNKWKKSPASIGGMSINSSISVSSSVGRKPFNRFV